MAEPDENQINPDDDRPNRQFEEAFPECFSGATEWLYAKDDFPVRIKVDTDRLREILLLTKRCFPVVLFAMIASKGTPEQIADVKAMYGHQLEDKGIADVLNALSKIVCEDKLIVSGLFIGDDGKLIINPCAEQD
jgi:hypothetical protein